MAFKIKNPINTPVKQTRLNPLPLGEIASKIYNNEFLQNTFKYGKKPFDAKKDHQTKKDLIQMEDGHT